MTPTIHIMPLATATELRSRCTDVSWMDADRRRRMEAFVHGADADRLFGADLLLRTVVAPLLHTTPAGVQVRNGDMGAPLIDGSALQVSITHAGPLVAVMVADVPCGVDIECTDAVSTEVFDAVCSAGAAHPMRHDTMDRAAYWTALEAAVKLRGTGFLDDPAGYRIERAGDGHCHVRWNGGSVRAYMTTLAGAVMAACSAGDAIPEWHVAHLAFHNNVYLTESIS